MFGVVKNEMNLYDFFVRLIKLKAVLIDFER